MKHLILGFSLAVMLAVTGCASTDKYAKATCDIYTQALIAANELDKKGLLSPATVEKISATTEPAKALCKGGAPTDALAVQKLANVVIAILAEVK